ncbi:MAG: hypothetical protein KGL10_09680 [Alphaproteobacteria bacterium]|nr:hypothetical protein [Alphaproteobacteria bacterium]
MPSQNGRDLILKIGDGASPENFTTIGAARTVEMAVSNLPADVTPLGGGGVAALQADGGVQALEITLAGLFKDSAAEESLRAAALGRTLDDYQLCFPNGAIYAASFAVTSYKRGGAYDALEDFTVTLARSGAGTFTAGS